MDIRKVFLEYFKKNDHMIIPSSSLVPQDDPSVLLTTAGMQQFKPYYLGVKKAPYPRIATVQKCFRTSDIDRVGYTEQHLTFFEMLGNFAFADYFKKEAIDLAMDFVLNIMNLPLEHLSVGVFAGDDDIGADDEAANIWKEWKIPEKRIYRFGKSENFWGPAGETGPCGPCTEIYYDFENSTGCGKDECSPECSCGRFLEIWNLVFTQYNFNGRNYDELPNKNIDTGMGLERIAAVLSGGPSVFRTEFFSPVVKKIERLSGKKFSLDHASGNDENINRCIRVIADHSRAVVFLLGDGVVPSNESRGYILRRVLRRAVRFARLLEIREYFLTDIAEEIINSYSTWYPELAEKKDVIFKTINDEEKRFSNTLKEGTKVLSQKIDELKTSGQEFLSPDDSFRLYDTYGFPVELTVEILNENNLRLDLKQFDRYLKMHSEKSRKKTVFDKKLDLNLELYKKIAQGVDVEFLGYQEVKSESQIKCLLRNSQNGKAEISEKLCQGDNGEIILERTPFYGEKGGEVGDRGIIRSENAVFIVEDTQIPLEGLVIHRGSVRNGIFKTSDTVSAEVDIAFRKNISKNHTSTHILHWALRTVLGKEVEQSGSHVTDDRFRFDYSVSSAPTEVQIEKIERIINEKIQKNDAVKCYETTKEYAEEIGAISLFEEKYGRFVRVVEVDDYSRELCGGIHVSRTGEIGLLKIVSDFSIGVNVRRIEAVTGMYAFNYLNNGYNILKTISGSFDTEPSKLQERLQSLKETARTLQEDITDLQARSIRQEILSGSDNISIKNGIKIIAYDFTGSVFSGGLDAKTMGTIGDEIINGEQNRDIFILFANIINNKPVMILQSAVNLTSKGIDCSIIAKEVGNILKGGGGGKPEFAQVGGSDPASLGRAFAFAKKRVLEILS